MSRVFRNAGPRRGQRRLAFRRHPLGLSAHHQVIAVTHLPQVAASGQTHFTVEKHVETGASGEITRTVVRQLDDQEREREVASLLSGERITETALAGARELLAARPD